jgi:hypothetical protein
MLIWIAIVVMVLAGNIPPKNGLAQGSILPDLLYDLVYSQDGQYYLLNTTTWESNPIDMNSDWGIVPNSLSPDFQKFIIWENQAFCIADPSMVIGECLQTPWNDLTAFIDWLPDSQSFWFDNLTPEVWKINATTGAIVANFNDATILPANASGYDINLSDINAAQAIAGYSYIDFGDPAILSIYVRDLESGSILQTLTPPNENGIAISPNGTLLANTVICFPGNCGDIINLYNWQSNQMTQIPIQVGNEYYRSMSFLYWANNSEVLAFIGFSANSVKTILYNINTDEFQILAQSNPVGTAGSDLAWSPDDNAIVQNICVGNSCELSIILPDNQQKISLIDFSDADDAQIIFWVPKNWLPDSAHVAPSAP